jgi:hypothetical protein
LNATALPLDEAIAQIEAHVAALGAALRERDAGALEAATQTLQRTLAASMRRLDSAARAAGGLPLPMQRRVALLNGQITAHREQLARAGASLERGLALLAPRDGVTYAAHGGVDPLTRGPVVGA